MAVGITPAHIGAIRIKSSDRPKEVLEAVAT
jgi:hypothetical protein